MPIYEYECPTCGWIEEHLTSNREPITCSGCNSWMHRIVSPTNFSLKGSGWYKDGYTNKDNKETT